MLYSRKNLMVAGLAPKADRYQCQGIHMTEQFTEVTNGHYAVRVLVPQNGDQKLDVPSPKEHKPFRKRKFDAVIEVDVAQDVLREFDKSKKTMTGRTALADVTWLGKECEGTEKVEFLLMDKDGEVKALSSKRQDVKFPNVDAVLKPLKRKPKFQLAFDPKYLKDICDLFVKAGETVVCISMYGDKKPVKFESSSQEQQPILAILMPKTADFRSWKKVRKPKPMTDAEVNAVMGELGEDGPAVQLTKEEAEDLGVKKPDEMDPEDQCECGDPDCTAKFDDPAKAADHHDPQG